MAIVDRGESEQGKSPLPADEQGQPQPERPVPGDERRRTDGQEDKPSQAEGERDPA
ncbi:MAG: hypothetical protein AB1941_28165 [Gemmatimonadota bacterium]